MLSKNKLQFYTALKQKKVREKENKFLVEGLRLCEELLNSYYEVEAVLYCAEKITSSRAKRLLQKVQAAKIFVEEIDFRQLDLLSDTVHSQGIIAGAKTAAFEFTEAVNQPETILIALDRINEPGNLGTIIRTANWFGAGAVLLSQESVAFTNPKVIRSSMGSVFQIPIFEKLDLVEKLSALKKAEFDIWVADLKGDKIYSEIQCSKKNVLVLGNETTGVDEKIKSIATAALYIPKQGKGESLNVAVAAGIILEKISRKTHLS